MSIPPTTPADACPPQSIEIAKLTLDAGTQLRPVNIEVAAGYAELMQDGDEFPPIRVFASNEYFWPVDGFHRIEARRQLMQKTITCVIEDSKTLRDAILAACGSNGTHGAQRTHQDKRAAVKTLLADSEWSVMSDRQIADACKVSNKFVGDIRRELAAALVEDQLCTNTVEDQTAKRIGKDGKKRRKPVKKRST